MPSRINEIPESFIQFPVPGIDNDSQGFRDRYTTIRNNLLAAKLDLDELVDNSSRVDQNNNFQGNKIIDANISASTVEANLSNEVNAIDSSTFSVAWTNGAVYVLNIDNNVTFNITDWPENGSGGNRYATIKLIVFTEGITRNITFISNGETSGIRLGNSVSTTLSSGTHYMYELSTYNEGETVYVRLLDQFDPVV